MAKKFLALALAIVMVFALAACGGGGGSSADDPAYLGTYESTEGEMMGIVLTGDDIAGFSITLDKNGKGSMDVEGSTGSITYTVEGDQITMDVEGEQIVGTLTEDAIVVDDLLGMGLKVTFTKA